MEEKWKLNSEDAKEFTGFPKKDGEKAITKVAENLPIFALMYKFRKEYQFANIESTLADHVGYTKKFKRLLSSEIINLKKAKGVVLLWAGLTEADKKETRDEITKFVEEDPFVTKDMIQNWDVIDLTKRDSILKKKEETKV